MKSQCVIKLFEVSGAVTWRIFPPLLLVEVGRVFTSTNIQTVSFSKTTLVSTMFASLILYIMYDCVWYDVKERMDVIGRMKCLRRSKSQIVFTEITDRDSASHSCFIIKYECKMTSIFFRVLAYATRNHVTLYFHALCTNVSGGVEQ